MIVSLAGTEGGVDDVLCETFEALQIACDSIGHPISNSYRFPTNCSKYSN